VIGQTSRSLDEKPIEVVIRPTARGDVGSGNTPSVAGRNNTAKGKNPMSVGGINSPPIWPWLAWPDGSGTSPKSKKTGGDA